MIEKRYGCADEQQRPRTVGMSSGSSGGARPVQLALGRINLSNSEANKRG